MSDRCGGRSETRTTSPAAYVGIMLADATRTGANSVALRSPRVSTKPRPTSTTRILRRVTPERAGSRERAGAIVTSLMLVVVVLVRVGGDRVVGVALGKVHRAIACGHEELAHHVVVLVRQVVAMDHV